MQMCTCGKAWMVVGQIPPCPLHSPPAIGVITYTVPPDAMRVAPGSDAVVWKISPEHCGEL
jgi:hypothetical protein